MIFIRIYAPCICILMTHHVSNAIGLVSKS